MAKKTGFRLFFQYRNEREGVRETDRERGRETEKEKIGIEMNILFLTRQKISIQGRSKLTIILNQT